VSFTLIRSGDHIFELGERTPRVTIEEDTIASGGGLSSSVDGLSVPLTISRDKLNNIVSGFGAQDATNVLRVPYKPSEQYRRRNHTALIPPCRRAVIMAVFLKTGRRPNGDGRSIR